MGHSFFLAFHCVFTPGNIVIKGHVEYLVQVELPSSIMDFLFCDGLHDFSREVMKLPIPDEVIYNQVRICVPLGKQIQIPDITYRLNNFMARLKKS